MSLKDKRVVVTGGSRGLGLGLVGSSPAKSKRSIPSAPGSAW